MTFLSRFAAVAAVLVAGLVAAPAAMAQETVEVADYSIGPADAKVEVIEYASFTCPHCANFHANVFKDIKKNYIDTGKIRFTYREVYFDRYGLWAAMIARCGGEMKYFGIADRIFEKQSEWAASDNAGVVVENLKAIGRAAGLDDAAMDACLRDQANAEALVAHFEKNFQADGVEGTPTFFINGTRYSNMSYADMAAILDAELAK